ATKLHLLAVEVGDELHVAASQVEDLALYARLEVARKLAAEAQERPVELELALVHAARELRAAEGLLVLRVRHVLAGERGEALELLLAALARRLGDERVDVVGEELERVLLGVLLAHEEERRAR